MIVIKMLMIMAIDAKDKIRDNIAISTTILVGTMPSEIGHSPCVSATNQEQVSRCVQARASEYKGPDWLDGEKWREGAGLI